MREDFYTLSKIVTLILRPPLLPSLFRTRIKLIVHARAHSLRDSVEQGVGLSIIIEPWGISSAGRAPRSQRGGRRFDPAMLHHFLLPFVVVQIHLSKVGQNTCPE